MEREMPVDKLRRLDVRVVLCPGFEGGLSGAWRDLKNLDKRAYPSYFLLTVMSALVGWGLLSRIAMAALLNPEFNLRPIGRLVFQSPDALSHLNLEVVHEKREISQKLHSTAALRPSSNLH